MLIKTDASGNKDWDNVIGGVGHDLYMGLSVQQTTDGGYIVCGETHLSVYVLLIKIDSEGNKLWDKKYGEEDKNENGNSVQQTIDGGYIICGTALSRKSPLSQVVLLIKTDVNGNEEWGKTFGGKKPAIGFSSANCRWWLYSLRSYDPPRIRGK